MKKTKCVKSLNISIIFMIAMITLTGIASASTSTTNTPVANAGAGTNAVSVPPQPVVSTSTKSATIDSMISMENTVPFQNSVKKAIINGTYSSADIEGPPQYSTEVLEKNETHIKVKSVTTITFKNPKGAGYGNNPWPEFIVDGVSQNNKIKSKIEKNIQGISNSKEKASARAEWNNYNFDYGKRTYKVTEIYDAVLTDQVSSTATSSSTPLATSATISSSIISPAYIGFQRDILMGNVRYLQGTYSRHFDLYISNTYVANADVNIWLYAALGLRLPTSASIFMPYNPSQGQNYTVFTNINGSDWTSNQYYYANVPRENGNEFVAWATLSVSLEGNLIGTHFGPYTKYAYFDRSKSFTTPFGLNERFPIDPIGIPPSITGLKVGSDWAWAGVGVGIRPDLGSGRITALWYAYGDMSGSGLINYYSPELWKYKFDVRTGDYNINTNNGYVLLYNYKYYLSYCNIALGANLQVGGWLIPDGQTGYWYFFNVPCNSATEGIYFSTYPGTSANSLWGYSQVMPQVTPVPILPASATVST